MRLLIEFILILTIVGLILFISNQNQKVDKHRKDIETFQDSIEILEKKTNRFDSLQNEYQDSIISYKNELDKEQEKQDSIEDFYESKIKGIEESKLSDLIDSTQTIIQTDTGTFVLVTESFYRKARTCDYKLEKLQAKVKVYKNKLAIKDSIIQIKDSAMNNLMKRIKNQDRQLNYKDSIITKQELIIDNKNSEITRQKLKKWIGTSIGGVAAASVALIILF